MRCFFCYNSEHLTENCSIYPTLNSRYEKLNYCFAPCLCPNVHSNHDPTLCISYCSCDTFCDVCLQKHHIALCPKKDPTHELFEANHSNSINLLDLDYHVIKRFLFLSTPVDKIKLHLTCKYLNHLQTPEYKLFNSDYEGFLDPNVIYTGYANITDMKLLSKNPNFNLEIFDLTKAFMTKSDLKLLSESDPISVNFGNCTYGYGITFFDFLEAFAYTLELTFTYNMLPPLWIKDLQNAKRAVNLRKLNVVVNDVFPDIDVDEIIKLFEMNEKLKIFISFANTQNNGFYSKIKKTMCHRKLYLTGDEEIFRVKFNFGQQYLMYCVSSVETSLNFLAIVN